MAPGTARGAPPSTASSPTPPRSTGPALGITDLEGRPVYDDTNALLATLNDLGELFDAARRALMAGGVAAA